MRDLGPIIVGKVVTGTEANFEHATFGARDHLLALIGNRFGAHCAAQEQRQDVTVVEAHVRSPSCSFGSSSPDRLRLMRRRQRNNLASRYSGATVTLMPSSSGEQINWQESRELGSTPI